jgi:L-threonylcarbamoyladenylate synthase
MSTPLLYLEDHPQAAVEQATEKLQAGKVVIFPTDTVYGLLCRATAEQAYRRIFELKQRQPDQPLALLAATPHAATAEALQQLKEHPDLLGAFTAGQLTIVLEATSLPSIDAVVLEIQPGTIGLRLPQHGLLQQVLAASGGLAWATSVNRSENPPAATDTEVLDWLSWVRQPVDLAVVSRQALPGTPSQVVKLFGQVRTIIR